MWYSPCLIFVRFCNALLQRNSDALLILTYHLFTVHAYIKNTCSRQILLQTYQYMFTIVHTYQPQKLFYSIHSIHSLPQLKTLSIYSQSHTIHGSRESQSLALIHPDLHTIQTFVQTPISTTLLFSFGQSTHTFL